MTDDRFYYRIVLADGTIFKDCNIGYHERSLWCHLKNVSFMEAFQYFSSPEKFETIYYDIVYTFGVIERFKFSGFNQIISIVQEEETIDVCVKGDNVTREFIKIEESNNEEAGEE